MLPNTTVGSLRLGQTPFKVVVVLDVELPGKEGEDMEQRPSAAGWGTGWTSNCYHLRTILPPAVQAVPAGLTTARGAPAPPETMSISLLSGLAAKPLPSCQKTPTGSQQLLSTGGSYSPTDMGSLLYTTASLFSPAQV